jgi:hypothetical protein
VPVIVVESPANPTTGLNEVIVGAPLDVSTVKVPGLVALPPGAVTTMLPVVAPVGTVTTNFVAEADVTVAAVPLKVTVF